MFEGGYRNREKIITPNKGHGVVAFKPDPVYQFPEGHPCHGCVFTFNENLPSCMTGRCPDTDQCVNAFYKKLLIKQRAEHEARLYKAKRV
jgi:hypothetical protein